MTKTDFWTDFWEDIKENPIYVIIILIAFLVAILGLLRVVLVEVLIAAVLIVLSSIVSLLFILHSSIRKFQKQLKSPTIGDILKPFHEMEGEIRLNIHTDSEIWLLSRTGQGWCNNFKEELINSLNSTNNNKARFLLLDPNNGALKMIEKSGLKPWNKFNHVDNRLWYSKLEAIDFLNHLKNNRENQIDLKVIDHLPAWTLIIINPSKRTNESIIYVELATYNASPEERPTFKVTSQDTEYFNLFIKQFEIMWEKARSWEIIENVDNPKKDLKRLSQQTDYA